MIYYVHKQASPWFCAWPWDSEQMRSYREDADSGDAVIVDLEQKRRYFGGDWADCPCREVEQW